MLEKSKKNILDIMHSISETYRIFLEIILAQTVPEYQSYTRQLLTQLETLRENISYLNKKATELLIIDKIIIVLMEKLNILKEANTNDEKLKIFWQTMRTDMIENMNVFLLSQMKYIHEAVENRINALKADITKLNHEILELNKIVEQDRTELYIIIDSSFDDDTVPVKEPFDITLLHESGISIEVNLDPALIQEGVKNILKEEMGSGKSNSDGKLITHIVTRNLIDKALEEKGHNSSEIKKYDIEKSIQLDPNISTIDSHNEKKVNVINENYGVNELKTRINNISENIKTHEKLIQAKEKELGILENFDSASVMKKSENNEMSFDDLFALNNVFSSIDPNSEMNKESSKEMSTLHSETIGLIRYSIFNTHTNATPDTPLKDSKTTLDNESGKRSSESNRLKKYGNHEKVIKKETTKAAIEESNNPDNTVKYNGPK